MDTALNEIQTLRRELDTFHNENIVLHNELVKQNKILFEQVISIGKELAGQADLVHRAIRYFNGQDLKVHLVRAAGMQTTEFIANNMNTVKVLADKKTHLRYALNQADIISGGYLEFGVYKGSTINLISETKPDKIIYGFDSFEGLPENWHDNCQKGLFNLNGNLPQVNENVRLIKGWFDQTLPDFVKAHPEPCAFIHIDCDLYSSAKTVLNTLKNQIISGTVIVFDEYFNYPGWQDNEYKVFEEFVAENNINFEYIARTNSTQVAVKIK